MDTEAHSHQVRGSIQEPGARTFPQSGRLDLLRSHETGANQLDPGALDREGVGALCQHGHLKMPLQPWGLRGGPVFLVPRPVRGTGKGLCH